MPVDLRRQEDPQSENEKNVNDLEDERDKQQLQTGLKVEQEEIVNQWEFTRRIEKKENDGDQTRTVMGTAIVAGRLLIVILEPIVRVIVESDRRDVDEEFQEKIEKEGCVRLSGE